MTQNLRIAVADDEPDMREYFRRILPLLGHQVVALCSNGRELVDQCRQTQPDLIITDIRMPELNGLEATTEIYRERPLPVILVSAYSDTSPSFEEQCTKDQGPARASSAVPGPSYFAVLLKPIKQADLAPAITLALRRFEQF